MRLSLFWTLLVMVERPTLYYAFVTPSDVFVRLAEIFIMGKCYTENLLSSCFALLRYFAYALSVYYFCSIFLFFLCVFVLVEI